MKDSNPPFKSFFPRKLCSLGCQLHVQGVWSRTRLCSLCINSRCETALVHWIMAKLMVL